MSPGAHWDWRSIAIVVGAFAVMAAAFGLAMWLDSDSGTVAPSEVSTATVESSSVDIVQAEIDAARAALATEVSSVEIVQAEIDAARAATAADVSSVEVVQAEIDAARALLIAEAFLASEVLPESEAAPGHGTSGGLDADSFGG